MVSEVAKLGRPRPRHRDAGRERDARLDDEPEAYPAKPQWVCRVTLR